METTLHGLVGLTALFPAEMAQNLGREIVQIHHQNTEEKTAAILVLVKK